jgi:hypothetical protein
VDDAFLVMDRNGNGTTAASCLETTRTSPAATAKSIGTMTFSSACASGRMRITTALLNRGASLPLVVRNRRIGSALQRVAKDGRARQRIPVSRESAPCTRFTAFAVGVGMFSCRANEKARDQRRSRRRRWSTVNDRMHLRRVHRSLRFNRWEQQEEKQLRRPRGRR